MSRSKKSRKHKAYSGENARVEHTTVHRYTAVDRGRFGEWWYRRGKIVKRVALFGGGGALFIYLIIEAVRSIF